MSAALDELLKDVKNDIMSLFEKSNMVSPHALHQQQLTMLAQQQSLRMSPAASSALTKSNVFEIFKYTRFLRQISSGW